MAAALLTACTQDGPAEPDTTLTEGRYPLQIDGITIDTQTRVTENSDGTGSVFQPDDWITVETVPVMVCTYLVQEDGSLIADPYTDPIYWPNKYMPLNITAHFSNTTLISDQSNRLAYLLQSTGSFTYGNPVVLTFTHQLAKVRVELTGSSADKVTQVEVYGYTRFTHRSGSIVTSSEPGWITMHRTTYDGQTYVWGANLVPGQMLADSGGASVRLNGSTTVSISGPGTLTAGAMHTIKVGVNEFPFPEGATPIDGSTGDISGEGDYYVTGTLTTPITITGGSPNIYLYKAEVISDNGPGINITSGSPTIHVVGTNNSVSSSASAGIYAAENATVTITGNSREDELTVSGGSGASGIGGYILETYNTYADCGDITIQHITLTASGSNSGTQVAPGIGSAGNAACGAITIDDATVYARGGTSNFQYAPGIGCGFPDLNSPTSIPTVIIKNQSVVHTHRGGNNTDYIGWAGDMNANTPATNSCNFGTGGSATSSTIYCYTGSSTDADHIFVYDASSNRTEQ